MILKTVITFVCLLPISGLLAMSLGPSVQSINTATNQDIAIDLTDGSHPPVLIDYPPMAENFGNSEPPSRDVPINSHFLSEDETTFMEDASSGEAPIEIESSSDGFLETMMDDISLKYPLNGMNQNYQGDFINQDYLFFSDRPEIAED